MQVLSTILFGAAFANGASIFDIVSVEWQTLNSTVGGRLFHGTPMALPCFTRYDDGTGLRVRLPDLESCAAVMQGKTDGPSIASYFGGYQVPNWGQCTASRTGCATCYQGSVPNYYIDCEDASHVQAGLRFARNHDIPLVIKNTGHDHRGRSSAPNSFALWTHNIKPELQFHTNFVPDSCPDTSGPALTYGAGYEFGDLYEAVHERGFMLVGGASKSVGASGGWLAGGGHGALTNSYGLGVDNVLEMKAVLPNGTIATANRCQNTDLFFALRGGGGGTFGVVLETTSRLHQETPMQMATISFGDLGIDQGSDFLSVLLENAERWAEQGWGGYIMPGLLSGTLSSFSAITSKLSLEEAQASVQPIIDFATSLPDGNVPLKVNITTIPKGYYDFLQTSTAETVGGFTGLSYALVSRLVPRLNFQTAESRGDLLGVMNELNRNKQPNFAIPFYILMVTPAAYELLETDQYNGPGQASVTPAWRDSLWQFVMPAVWDPQDPTALGAGSVDKAFTNAHNAINPLRQITPTSGAYQNEADIFEPDPINNFWGQENYNRLLMIKRELDPSNLLTCYNCVGWDPSDERYGCYPQKL